MSGCHEIQLYLKKYSNCINFQTVTCTCVLLLSKCLQLSRSEIQWNRRLQCKIGVLLPSVTSRALICSSPADLTPWTGLKIALRLSNSASFSDLLRFSSAIMAIFELYRWREIFSYQRKLEKNYSNHNQLLL